MERLLTIAPSLSTLPGDDVRQILWRFTDRYDIQMVAQSARTVARTSVAKLVAEGGRNTHEWTQGKANLLRAYDEAGITAAFMEPGEGGYLEGPKNLLLALVAFELAWVDAGAATGCLAGNLALAPIRERGTDEQRMRYLALAVPPAPGEPRTVYRGAFALTEPIPFVGVDTGVLGGSVKVASWEPGEEPMLQVSKRGRFITNMGFANFVTAAVDSADPRFKGSCMIILEKGDPGIWDRGTPTRKMVHQLSSTSDPVLDLRVPASRIVGGYSVVDGVIVPTFSHGEVIEAVFRRTRVTVGVMTAAKLLSAVEPVIRYQRGRFRGGDAAKPNSPRFEQGLQQKEDTLQRLIDVWAGGEAAASMGFSAARLFDTLEPLEKEKDAFLKEQGKTQGREKMKALDGARARALELLALGAHAEDTALGERRGTLEKDPLVRFVLLDSLANVVCPAVKLWNTGFGANLMREAVSLMGGYGITEDCPGFLGHKWMDAQLEATYEGPEAVQRRQLSVTMTNEVFLAQLRGFGRDLRQIASTRPGTGACTVATALEMWRWTLSYLQRSKDASGRKLYQGARQGVTFALADALCWLLAARALVLDVVELEEKGKDNAALAETLPGLAAFYTDLCHVLAARAAGEVGRICAELVFGYSQHPAWDEESCRGCFHSDELDALESFIPGIATGARTSPDVIEENAEHPAKAGPCVRLDDKMPFVRLRLKLDGCLTGARLAKDRAAEALTKVVIPEALDYPR